MSLKSIVASVLAALAAILRLCAAASFFIGIECVTCTYNCQYINAAPHKDRHVVNSRNWLLPFEMRLDLFQGFALGFRQEEGRHDEVDHREAGEEEEDGRVTVLADEGQEDTGERGGGQQVEDQRDAHSIGADAGGHQLGEG